MSESTRGKKAYAYSAFLWVLSAIVFGSLALIAAGHSNPAGLSLVGLMLSGVLFAATLFAGFRAKFVLGLEGESTRLRRLSAAISATCFVLGWSSVVAAYASGGDVGVSVGLRAQMPTTVGLSLGVLGGAASCLFLWESAAAVLELRGAKGSRGVIVASILSLAAATFCAAALSSVVTGHMYFFGAG